VWLAADLLDGVSGRKILLLVTDGRASANFRGFEEAAERVVSHGITVHTIQTVSPKLWARIDTGRDPSESLRTLASRTKGSFVFKDPTDLPEHVGTLVRTSGR
jgi:hypothetical protein